MGLTIAGSVVAAYFSNEEKQMFENTIGQRRSYEAKFEEMYNLERDREAKAEEMKKLRATAKQDKDDTEASITSADRKQQELKREDTQVSGELSKAKGELDTLNNQLAEMAKAVGDLGVNFDTIGGAITDLENDVRDKNTKNEELKVVREGAVKKVQGEESEIGRRQGVQSDWRALVRRNGTEATITAVNPDWGFVVINAGESAKIDPAVPLIVTRNGKRVGQLRIVSVEKNQTVADVVPGSVREGDAIAPGDTVILKTPQG